MNDMATAAAWTESDRQRYVDADAERRYWMKHSAQLPGAELFEDSELQAAIALGIEAMLRHSRPSTIQGQLKACYERMVRAPLVDWAQVLEVAEHVYRHAATGCTRQASAGRLAEWPWALSKPSLRQCALQVDGTHREQTGWDRPRAALLRD
jgi:hypothetical protein